MASDENDGGYFWCLTHQRVEPRAGCRADDRLGPFATAEEARDWKTRNVSRTERWEDEDERWAGWGEEEGEGEA